MLSFFALGNNLFNSDREKPTKILDIPKTINVPMKLFSSIISPNESKKASIKLKAPQKKPSIKLAR